MDDPETKVPGALRGLVLALYLPVLGAIGYTVFLCVRARFHGQDLGLYQVLYSAIFLVLAWRWVKILRGRVTTRQLWQDCLAMALADALLGFLLLGPAIAGLKAAAGPRL